MISNYNGNIMVNILTGKHKGRYMIPYYNGKTNMIFTWRMMCNASGKAKYGNQI